MLIIPIQALEPVSGARMSPTLRRLLCDWRRVVYLSTAGRSPRRTQSLEVTRNLELVAK